MGIRWAVAAAPGEPPASASGQRPTVTAGGIGYAGRVIPLEAVAAAYAQWIAPDLPLYGNDHERTDFAP